MLDIKLIRKDKAAIEKQLQTKVPGTSLTALCDMDDEIRNLKTQVEQLKAERNDISKQIGEKKRVQESADDLLAKVAGMADQIHVIDARVAQLEQAFAHELASLPNLPMADIKVSPDPKDNVLIKEVGQPPRFAFKPRNHLELNETLHLFDFKRAAKISGGGWPAYRGMGARFEWALINYMLNIHIKNGFEMWMPPLMVREEVVFGSGQLPKFKNQQFRLEDPEFPLYLIPTAEVALNGLHMGEIIPDEGLPLKYCAYTPCFRREAGAAGEKERGLIRVHQFNKVEMFIFCKPEESTAMFDLMLKSAEEILNGLELHFREMLLVTGDMSFAASRTVDVEVWLPGQDRYYEVSSISNCTDYQARRSDIRFRRKGEKPEFVHTLNGSGLATSRLLVALLENNQRADGSVAVPKCLQSYLGVDQLLPEGND
jgi:seryl-tRNA synthetase